MADDSLPPYDAVISFVLYHTDPTEIRQAVDQVLSSPGRLHTVLVDNSTPPLDLRAFADDRVTILQPGVNLGYGAGHNLALRRFAGRTRYHFVLNTDLTFGSDAIPKLLCFMDAHSGVGITMPLVRYPDGRLQHLCRLLPRPVDVFARAFLPRSGWTKKLTARYESHGWTYDQPFDFPFLSGCFMVLRPEVLAEVGGFDERFFLFAEDLDLSRRFHRVSETRLCPTVEVRHEYRTRAERNWKRQMLLMRSLAAYFNKYGWIFDSERESMNRRALAQICPKGD